MKKQVLFLSFLLLIFILSFVVAEENESSPGDSSSQIDKAYKCLEDKVKDKCSTSLQDNIFTLLAVKKCSKEVLDSSRDQECWPKENCDIKTTAQSILALNSAGSSTSKAESWILSQTSTPLDVMWYLEIESPKSATCKIKYKAGEYTVNIGEDKKISSSAGSCLSLSEGNYWLRVSQFCYDEEFEISCNEQFLTTLLFKKQSSSTIHVSETAHSSSAEGTTKEKIISSCFAKAGKCDYEGTLWATLVLSNLKHDVSAFFPYLITMTEENKNYLPESFLYLLTRHSDFRADLLLKQKEGKYWEESGDKFYDTALALYPFQYEEVQEKSNSKEWLMEIQGADGCWDGGKIKSNAFVLYSLWPRGGSLSSTNDEKNCVDSGYYCMPEIDCKGELLANYLCSGVAKCCDAPKVLESCENQGGEICSSGYACVGGVTTESTDSSSEESCCVGGTCQIASTENTSCESSEGVCRAYSCNEDEEESLTYSCDYGDSCCIKKNGQESYFWIWLLSVLIILVVLAIIFKDRLRFYYDKFRSDKKLKPGPSQMSPSQKRPFIPRRILPPTQTPVRKPLPKKSGEIDEVLKKLKEMGG